MLLSFGAEREGVVGRRDVSDKKKKRRKKESENSASAEQGKESAEKAKETAANSPHRRRSLRGRVLHRLVQVGDVDRRELDQRRVAVDAGHELAAGEVEGQARELAARQVEGQAREFAAGEVEREPGELAARDGDVQGRLPVAGDLLRGLLGDGDLFFDFVFLISFFACFGVSDDYQRQTRSESPAQSLLSLARVRLGRRQQQQTPLSSRGRRKRERGNDGGNEASRLALSCSLSTSPSVTIVFLSLQRRPSAGQTRLSLRPDSSAQRFGAFSKEGAEESECAGEEREREFFPPRFLPSSSSTFFFEFLSTLSLCFSFSLYRRRPSSLSLITHRVPVGVQVRHVDRGVPVVCRELERLEREVHECRKEKKKTTKKEEPAAAARRMPRR